MFIFLIFMISHRAIGLNRGRRTTMTATTYDLWRL